ncbi:hypothetical protein QUA56_35150 [Microcoleus sp. N3A4]|uniref:hypothetical protein n=1 Tax=Microcoleus sp. N3A4 TaxID=3055379 RepID=UPI002FD2B4FC
MLAPSARATLSGGTVVAIPIEHLNLGQCGECTDFKESCYESTSRDRKSLAHRTHHYHQLFARL